MSLAGVQRLAREIFDFWSHPSTTSTGSSTTAVCVCIPGGTCTTALFLHREIQRQMKISSYSHLDISVAVIPCVGDADYARRQMVALDLATGGDGNIKNLPQILSSTTTATYYSFGQPHVDILDTYREMKEDHGICLDLLYGASAWTLLLQHWDSSKIMNSPLSNRQVMYVHSGGLKGNASQMTRYKQKVARTDESASVELSVGSNLRPVDVLLVCGVR